MRNKRFPNYPDDADYNTNAPSYYDDLARKQKLIEMLAKKIWEYEQKLDLTLEEITNRLESYIDENDTLMNDRLEQWDLNLEKFPENVEMLLQEWLSDGTLDHIINETIFNWKLDTSIFEQFRDSTTTQLQQTANNLNSRINVLYPPTPFVAAVGDGENDDTGAIQSLLSNFNNVYFPKPAVHYKITAPLLIKATQQLSGDGVRSRIQGYGNYDALIKSHDQTKVITQLKIENLWLLKDEQANIQYGLDLKEVAYSTFRTIQVDGFDEAGIRLYNNSASYNSLYDVIAKNCKDGIKLGHNANSTRIYNAVCSGNDRNGLRIGGEGVHSVQTCGVFSGSFEGNGESGIWLEGRGCTINNAHIEGNALNADFNGIDGTNTSSLYDNTIIGCYFHNNGDTGGKHVFQVPEGQKPQAVFSFLHPTIVKYIVASGFYGGSSNTYSFLDDVSFYSTDGKPTIQTGGSNKPFSIRGKGGFNVPLELGSGMKIDPTGKFSNSAFYQFDSAIRLLPIDRSVVSPPANSIFIDSNTNTLKFKTSDGVDKTISLS